jgi:type I restriction enzyme S subunit
MKNLRDTIVYAAHGAVQQCLFISDIANLKTIYPNHTEMSRYTDVSSIIENKIAMNHQESRRLAQLRDTLLPRLMSGELKVNEIENVL